MAVSSYDELVKEVENLKAENSHLRKELADNSSLVGKPGNEACSMKDFLALPQDNMQEESVESSESAALPDQNSNDARYRGNLKNAHNWSVFEPLHQNNCEDNSFTDCKPNTQEVQVVLQELNDRRTKILLDIASEEKERHWFLSQLEKIKQHQHRLPPTDNCASQNDVTNQQLELEAHQLREAMHRKLGSGSEILQRHEMRMQSLQLLDEEAGKLQEQPEVVNKHKYSSTEGRQNNCAGDLQDMEVSQYVGNCPPSPPTAMKTSKMTTSSTQTTIDLYPTDYASNNITDSSSLTSMYNGTWPMDKVQLWHSSPSTYGDMNSSALGLGNQETSSVMSFTSSMNSTSSRRSTTHQLGTKVEMVYSLLSMLGSHDKDEMSKTLLAMSSSRDSCVAMRQSGCMPLLIQLLHGGEKDCANGDTRSNREARARASKALHNIVHAHPDDKRGRREARVLRLLEQIRDYCDNLRDGVDVGSDEDRNASGANTMEQHPGPSMAALMKLSFDEEHRHAMCQLGGLPAIAELIEVDYALHGNTGDQYCVTLRRYAGMALTNLTFGDGTNKALLCSMKSFMKALVAQLHSPSEDLRQVVASVLRNLSWRADPASKKILREVGAVVTLMKASMEAKKESTLKSILSALWNLSAHCSINKADICAVDGALAFLVSTLTYKSASKTLAIVENGGGILRNISSQIAEREDYRAMLRQHNCLHILLQHLRSSSLTIVSNACGTLWNLSARCSNDQQALWEMGAVSMLRNLVHSKHKMISMGSSAALKNLLTARPNGMALAAATSPASGDGHKSALPSLLVRKQRALEAEIDQNLAETCDNIDSPKSSPTHRVETDHRNLLDNHVQYQFLDQLMLHGRMYHSGPPPVSSGHVDRSDSKDSIKSTQSDTSYDRLQEGTKYPNYTSDQRFHPDIQKLLGSGLYNNLSKTNASESSRIAHVFQEVRNDIALEEAERSDFNPNFASAFKSVRESNSTLDNSLQSHGGSHFIYDKYSNLTNKVENLNSNECDNSKCSSKYSNEDNEHHSDVPSEKLTPKIDNYMSDKMQKEKCGQNDAMRQPTPKQTNKQWQGINTTRNNKTYFKNSNADESNLNSDAVFSTYAETDLDELDQPTNFSLLYTEDNDTTDKFVAPAPESHYYPGTFDEKPSSVNDDAMKTYYTEGTPLNFSMANSMTDLRDLSNKEKLLLDANKEFQKPSVPYKKEHDQIVSSGNTGTTIPQVENLHLADELLCSDKTTTYCVEGTPVYFSRVSSLSSLHSGDMTEQQTPALKDNQDTDLSPNTHMKLGLPKDKNVVVTEHHSLYREKFAKQQISDQETTSTETKQHQEKEGKSVSFGADNVAEETPLMFSRCSSLGSLSSFDQHSIHDDRSSVVSDFSRRASGVVSPSDLPDSPSQTMPPSPKRTKPDMDFPPKPLDNKSNDVFGDSVQTYTLEDTPFQFSTATSLSSLAIDDDAPTGKQLDLPEMALNKEEKEDSSRENLTVNCNDQSPKGSDDSFGSREDLQIQDLDQQESQSFSDPEENEDDILAACINSAMPNNSKQNKRTYNNSKLSSKVNKISCPPRMRTSGIPVKTMNVRMVREPLNAATSLPPSKQRNMNYRNVSLSASNDDRSNSGKSNISPGSFNDNSSDNSLQGDELLLAQCIQSGMPKSRVQRFNNINLSNASDGTPNKLEASKGTHHRHHLNNKNSSHKANSKTSTGCLSDSFNVYAVEGTPNAGSRGSSISDLTIESHDGNQKGKEKQGFREPRFNNTRHQTDYDSSADAFCHYAEEGTPFTVSRHDSLSSLSCCNEETDYVKEKEERKRSHKDNLLYRIPGKYSSNGNGRSHSLPVMHPRARAPGVGMPGTTSGNPTGFSTPALQRQNTIPQAGARFNQGLEASSVTTERHTVFQVENTPVCFSRNSSLSSLSVESLGAEPSPDEQALLDECINSGMPKNKVTEKKRNRTHRRKGGGKDVKQNDPKKPEEQAENKLELDDGEDVSEAFDDSMTENSLYTDTTLTIASSSSITINCQNFTFAPLALPRDADSRTDAIIASESSESRVPEKESPKQNSAMSDSKLLEIEASKLALEMRHEADGMSQSANSGYSDLDNVKPPSVMGDVMSLTCSMVSSCASESTSEQRPMDAEGRFTRGMDSSVQASKRGSKKKHVPELVLRALGGNPDSVKLSASTEMLENIRPSSGMGSAENLSMRSSASEILDNIKPPSILEDIDLTSSIASVASITSEVAEGRSEAFSLKGSINSDMLEVLKPVIAMAELYAREGMLAGSTKSSCHSELIENVNPPSMMQDFTDCYSTINDVSATLGSDTDADDDDLPEDVPIVSAATEEHKEQNNSSEKSSDENTTEQTLHITPELLQENANLVVNTLNEFRHNESNDESSLADDIFIECETLSLVSNESESEQSNDAMPVARGPRIVKPIGRDPFREVPPQATTDNGPKPVRGKRRSVTKPRQPLTAPVRSQSPKAKDNTPVKPTRTSALRATQSQQKLGSPPRQVENTTAVKRTPRTPSNSVSPSPATRVNIVTPRTAGQGRTYKPKAEQNPDGTKTVDGEIDVDENRPKPPIKQGTFTKDKPSQDTAPKISPSKIKPPTPIGGKPPTPKSTSDVKENTPVHKTVARSRMLQSRSLDDRSSQNGRMTYTRTPSAGVYGRGTNCRIQSQSPMNRKVSNSLNNLKKGTSPSTMRNSASNQNFGTGVQNFGRRTPNSGLNSRCGSGTLDTRSSSNQSLCSNVSSNTTASAMTNNSTKKASVAAQPKKEVVSKVAALWKRDGDKPKTNYGDTTNNKAANKTPTESTTSRSRGLPSSSTYEKIPNFESNVLPGDPKQPGMRLEDKNQLNNKTFTKSPSVDSKLGSIMQGTDNKSVANAQDDGVWVKRHGSATSDDDGLPEQCALMPDEIKPTSGETGQLARPKCLQFGPLDVTYGDCYYQGKLDKPTGLRSDTKTSPAAANVAPLTHVPSSNRGNAQTPPSKSLIPTPTKAVPPPPSAKRRDSYLNSIEPKTPEAAEPKRNTCMITTV